MSIDRRLQALEERYPEAPEAGPEDDPSPEEDYFARDRSMARLLPQVLRLWVCGRLYGYVEADFTRGPFAGREEVRRAWGAYQSLRYKACGDIFDLWYPDPDPECREAKLALVRAMKAALASHPEGSDEHTTAGFLPRDDGEADRWAPREPVGDYSDGYWSKWPDAYQSWLHAPGRVGIRRRWLQRMADAGDAEAAEDLAALDAEAAAGAIEAGPERAAP